MHKRIKALIETVHLSLHAPYLEPELRRKHLQCVTEIMGVYSRCFDEQWHPVSAEELLSETTSDSFRSFVFMD